MYKDKNGERLRREINNHEPNPAPHHSQRRIRARKHKREELIARAEDHLVDQRAIYYERNGDGIVQHRKPIKQKHSRPHRHGRKSLKGEEKENKPEDRADGLDWELGGGEK
jgi:hypothetical protein